MLPRFMSSMYLIADHDLAHMPLTVRILVAIGALWSTRQAMNLLSFLNLYLFRRNTLTRYIGRSASDSRGETWALVTGAQMVSALPLRKSYSPVESMSSCTGAISKSLEAFKMLSSSNGRPGRPASSY